MAKANRLKISTILDSSQSSNDFSDTDQLLLASLDGVEGISQGYAYDLTLLRPTGSQYPPIAPDALINSPATIGIKLAADHFESPPIIGPIIKGPEVEDTYTYIQRHGVFMWFEASGHRQFGPDKSVEAFVVYKARLVSAFQMLSNEIVYRVFEKMDVIAIIQAVTTEFPNLDCDVTALIVEQMNNPARFPPMEICFQFGESSFNFVSRLMTQFGIWYYFEHDPKAKNEKMVLRTGPAKFDPCQVKDAAFNQVLSQRHVQLDQQVLVDKNPSVLAISDFTAHYLNAPNFVRTRNFNTLLPTATVKGQAKIEEFYDVLQTDGAPGGKGQKTQNARFQVDAFPSQQNNTTDADADAAARLTQEENHVYVFSGSSKNPAFMVGQKFQIMSGRKSGNEPGTADVVFPTLVHSGGANANAHGRPYNITFLHFKAFENSFGHHLINDAGTFLADFFSPITDLFTRGKIVDLALAATAGGVNNYIKSVRQNANQNAIVAANNPKTGSGGGQLPTVQAGEYNGLKNGVDLTFGAYFDAGAIASITTLIPLFAGALSKGLDDVLTRHGDDFSTSFAASLDNVPMPLPGAAKPVAGGVHLAVVIGPEGANADPKSKTMDFYADALGRVRVRFPWDPGPSPANQAQGAPTWESPDADDPYASDRNTCWVRISEAWAGRNYGSQFVPRIGEEVIVSFLDGDPDRPIITGRVYNADRSRTNLPLPSFDPSSVRIAVDATQNSLLNPTIAPPYNCSGIKTRSTFKPNDKPEGYHLLRFDDSYDAEQLLLRSQGRLDVTALHDCYQTTYGDRHVLVKPWKDDKGAQHGGNNFTTVSGAYDLHIGGDRLEKVEKNYQLTVKADTTMDLEGNWSAMVGNTLTLNAGTIVIEASKKLTLKVGASSVVLTPCGVYVDGPMIYENCGGSPDSAANQSITDPADAQAADPGDPWGCWLKKQPAPPGGGGGGSSSHTVPAQHAPPCAMCGQQVCVDPAGECVS